MAVVEVPPVLLGHHVLVEAGRDGLLLLIHELFPLGEFALLSTGALPVVIIFHIISSLSLSVIYILSCDPNKSIAYYYI